MLPFGTESRGRTYFSDLFVDYLSQKGYDLVERERITEIIAELQLNQQDAAAPATAVKIGKLVGAHIIITGNISSYQEQERVIARAFDVETSEILGSGIIEPEQPERVFERLVATINQRLVYRSVIDRVDGDAILLVHGARYGAAEGMKVQVLASDNRPIGVLEIKRLERDRTVAKSITTYETLQSGMRVEEIKD